MTYVEEQPNTGIWALSLLFALAAHAAMLAAGMLSYSNIPAPENRATEINVTALALEKPDTSVSRTDRAVPATPQSEALETVESQAIEASRSDSLSATQEKDRLEAAQTDGLAAAEAATAARQNEAEALSAQTAQEAVKAITDSLAAKPKPQAPALSQEPTASTADKPKSERVTATANQPATPAAPRQVTRPTSTRSSPSVAASPAVARPSSQTTRVNTATSRATSSAVVSTATTTSVGKTTTSVSSPQRVEAPANASSSVAVTANTAAVSVGTEVVSAPSKVAASSAPSASVAAVSKPSGNRVTALPKTIQSVAPTEDVQPEPKGEVAGDEVEEKPSAEETAALYQDMLDSISAYDGGDCFAAIPTIGSGGTVSLRSFARTENEVQAFASTLEDQVGLAPSTSLKAVSNAQCAALSFASLSPTYPQFNMFIEMEETDIVGRQADAANIEFQLSGYIGNMARGFRYLIVVDDEGLVQDLSSFMSPGLSRVGFNMDLTFKGDRVDTEILVLAISSTSELSTVRSYSGRPAEKFFQRLNLESVMTGTAIDLAVASFRVR